MVSLSISSRLPLLVALLCIALSSPAGAQGVLTVAAIGASVQSVISKLNDLVPVVGGQVNIAVGVAGQELTNKLNQLNDLARDHLDEPITNLTLEAQQLARQIQASVSQLESAISSQRVCAVQDATLLISAIRNVGEGLKAGVPLVESSSQVSHFVFDNAPPRAVPLAGGRVTVFGSNLWSEPGLPPVVKLQTRDGQTTFQTFEPARSSSNDSFTISIAGGTLNNHIGECLQLAIQERHREGFFRRVKSSTFALPVCVPERYATQLVVEGSAAYHVRRPTTIALNSQNAGRTNDSCERGVTVATQVHWNLPSGQNISDARIVSIAERQGNNTYNGQNVACTIASTDTVACNGSLDSARCVGLPFGASRLLHSSVFERVITPTVQYLQTEERSVSGVSSQIPLASTVTQLKVPIPLPLAADLTIVDASFSFKVVRLINGARVGSIYEGPRTVVPLPGGGSVGPVMAAEFQVDGSFNPIPVSGQSEISVNVRAPTCPP